MLPRARPVLDASPPRDCVPGVGCVSEEVVSVGNRIPVEQAELVVFRISERDGPVVRLCRAERWRSEPAADIACWRLQYLQPMDGSEWVVESHLAGKPTEIVGLYRGFIGLLTACGPFSYAVSKTAITLKGTRRGFAGAKPTHRSLDGYLDLQRQVRDPRIRRSSPYTKGLFVHQFRITTPDQLDDVFAGWVRDAYAVGSGAHLNREIP
jgi:Domain of unknown function (DUF5655)